MKKISSHFIILLTVISLFGVFSGHAETATAKKTKSVKTDKDNVSLYAGKSKTIRITNKTKKKAKLSIGNRKICKAKVTGKKIKITGKADGSTVIKVKVSGLKPAFVKVTVKKSKNLEAGSSAKYPTFKSYPWKKNYKKLDKIRRFSIELNWKYMPTKIKDMMCYYKIPVIFTNSIAADGVATKLYGKDKKHQFKIRIRINSANDFETYNEGILIHEAAHCYDFRYQAHRFCAEEYHSHPDKYGQYGSKNIKEYYAEKIANACLYNKRVLTDKMMDEYFDKYFQVVKDSNGSKELTANTSYFKDPISIIRYNGTDYYNGMTNEEYISWFHNQQKRYLSVH